MKIIYFSLIICSFWGCKTKSNKHEFEKIKQRSTQREFPINDKSIDGEWVYSYNLNKDSIPQTLFTLTIKRSGNEIHAQYSAIAQYGNKIDRGDDAEFNINGFIQKNKIQVTFYSFFELDKHLGHAELFLLNKDSLKWIVTKKPDGEFYAPMECILTREIN